MNDKAKDLLRRFLDVLVATREQKPPGKSRTAANVKKHNLSITKGRNNCNDEN